MYIKSGGNGFGRTTAEHKQRTTNQRYINSARKKHEENERFAKRFIFSVIFLVAIIAGIFYFGLTTDFCEKRFGKDAAITQFFANLAGSNAEKAPSEFTFPIWGRRKNILLLGVDVSENPDDLWTGTRTDTIILLNVDPHTKSINAVSIPRDSKVYLPDNYGVQKINSAHALGGVNMTKRTIENTLGVRIDKYIMVHDNAVKSIVEALGGVDVYVEKNMHYHDYAGKLHIDLNKGYNHLNPEQAVGYLRFRHDPLGDIGRTQRQQWFLRGVLNDLKKPEKVAKIPEIVNVAKKYIKTDMSPFELTQFAMLAKGLDMDKVEIAMLPGAPNKSGVISYWILDPEKTQEVINRLILRKKVDDSFIDSPTASVVYTDSKLTEAQNIISELKEAGITVSCETHISKAHSQFIAHKPRITNEYYNRLKREHNTIEGYQFVYDPAVFLCGDTDFTIVVAGK